MRRDELRGAGKRIGIARAALLATLLVLAARAAHLSVVDERGAALGTRQGVHSLALPPERGMILDRDGAELALTIHAPSIYVIRSELEDVGRAAQQLAPVLGWKSSTLEKRLRGRRKFAFLARWVEPKRAQRVRDLGLHGVGVLDEPRRVYPHKELAAQILGFSNIDGEGVRGIEQQEDAWLRGTARRVPVERDARGRLLVMPGNERWSTVGGDVALTIDVGLQADADRALRHAVEATNARAGIVVSMDPYSGDLWALAEAPSFDPNEFRHLEYRNTRSRAFLDSSDPGSTFKAFLMAAALENGPITPADIVDCENGFFRVPGKTIRDHHPYGDLDPAGILRVSSNIGAVKIAYALGANAHFEMLRRFGFGSTTGSRFPDESSGVLRSWKDWRPVDHATIAFGQGVSVTTIQLVAATAALANGGEWVRPRLVAARRAPGGVWQTTSRDSHRVIRAETAATLLAMLETVVGPGGTGRRAALEGVRVAGKTGTAQKFDRELGVYSESRYVAWFIGVAPADDPRLVIVVALDEPQTPAHTGGAVAAPLFARVAAAQLARFGILTNPVHGPHPTTRKLVASTTSAPASVSTPPPARVRAPVRSAPKPTPEAPPRRLSGDLAPLGNRLLLPDFLGLTVREVIQITEDSALAVEISGEGRAVAQEPPPGTILALPTARVRIRFNSGGGEG